MPTARPGGRGLPRRLVASVLESMAGGHRSTDRELLTRVARATLFGVNPSR